MIFTLSTDIKRFNVILIIFVNAFQFFDKTINTYKVSKYTLNYKLVLLKEKNEKKIRKEAEKALREQSSSEPFSELKSKDELLYDNNETKVEFFLHTPPKSTHKTSTSSYKRKSTLEIESLKKYVDPNDRLSLNLKLVPTAELEEVITLYKPIFGQLSIVSQAWYDFVRYELKRRNGEDIP